MSLYEIIANGKHAYIWAYSLIAAYMGAKMWYLPGTHITIVDSEGIRHNFTKDEDESAR